VTSTGITRLGEESYSLKFGIPAEMKKAAGSGFDLTEKSGVW
jgi:hypothetical protein